MGPLHNACWGTLEFEGYLRVSKDYLHMIDVLALVTARGGSKGVPRKNVNPLHGKPLIAWTIDAALAARAVTRVVVSTDDEETASVGSACGAEVPFMRPLEHAGDESSHIGVLVHAIEWFEENEGYLPEYILTMQPTSPLRTVQDIDAACSIAEANRADAVVGVEETHHHPFLVRRIGSDGKLEEFVPTDGRYLRRQDLPPAYAVNGAIFLNRRESLLRDRTFEPVGTYPYIMPSDRSLQIDTPWDWFLIEQVLGAQRAE
jgi:CMP-N,N'-diacetyllegionaminic acid synthase